MDELPPSPPPSFEPFPPPGPLPPLPRGASRIAAAAKFISGGILAVGAGFLLFVTLFKDIHHISGCAVAQLVYIVPAVLFLLFKRQPAWAFGIVFGGAVVVLLGSICANVRWAG
jgi:hypothetical protein